MVFGCLSTNGTTTGWRTSLVYHSAHKSVLHRCGYKSVDMTWWPRPICDTISLCVTYVYTRPVGRNFKVVRYQWGSGVKPPAGFERGTPTYCYFNKVFLCTKLWQTVNKVIPSCFRELFSLNKNFHNYSGVRRGRAPRSWGCTPTSDTSGITPRAFLVYQCTFVRLNWTIIIISFLLHHCTSQNSDTFFFPERHQSR